MPHTRALLSDSQLEQLHQAAVRILAEAGMRFESQRLLGYLERAGARVDPARCRAFFPPEMTARMVELLRQPAAAGKVSQLVSREVGDEFRLDWGYEAFFLYDWPSRDRRHADEQDLIELMQVGEALPEIGSVGLPALNSQTDQRIEALETIALLLRHTSKHRGAGMRTPEQVPFVVAIDELLGYGPRRPHFAQLGRCMISPLSFGADAAGIFEALMDCGWQESFWVATMPLAGGTGPVTAAGTVALLIAEILGGWMLIKAINPEAEVQATVISGTLDMRRACAAFAAPEAILQDLACIEYFRRTLGRHVGYDPGYTDAKVPGLQCAWEKCFKQMAYAMYAAPALTIGSLEGAATFSPTQAMLELDLCRQMWRFLAGFEVTPETLAVQEIIDVCAADGKSFLQTDHTFRHYREALSESEFLRRGPWTDGPTEWAQQERILDEADAKWRAAKADYIPPDVDEEQLREVDKIIAKARAVLCG
jgi:trimethylamine---corrinoid protein Co-methyltransferase